MPYTRQKQHIYLLMGFVLFTIPIINPDVYLEIQNTFSPILLVTAQLLILAVCGYFLLPKNDEKLHSKYITIVSIAISFLILFFSWILSIKETREAFSQMNQANCALALNQVTAFTKENSNPFALYNNRYLTEFYQDKAIIYYLKSFSPGELTSSTQAVVDMSSANHILDRKEELHDKKNEFLVKRGEAALMNDGPAFDLYNQIISNVEQDHRQATEDLLFMARMINRSPLCNQ